MFPVPQRFYQITFAIYALGLCWVLLFFSFGSFSRIENKAHNHNIIPFQQIHQNFRAVIKYKRNRPTYIWHFTKNILGNIILFVPWGILAPRAFPFLQNSWLVFLSALLFSASAELIQLTFDLGQSDVDDTILNVTGAMIGWNLIKKRVRRETK